MSPERNRFIDPEPGRVRERKPITARAMIIGGLALLLFSILLLRLWSLQVVTGDEYVAEANDNRTLETRVRAPRGEVLDRNGRILVGNRSRMAIQLDPTRVPDDRLERRSLFESLSPVIDRSTEWIARRYWGELSDNPPGTFATLVEDADDEAVFYLQENGNRFPQVHVSQEFVRRYPLDTTAAHLLGSVGEADAEDLESREDLIAGDTLGKAGIEETYDADLRGEAGTTRLQVDSIGRIKGRLASTSPEPGNSIRLTIDADIQTAGESALRSIGLPGAFVAMDTRNGEILGLGSNPTVDPAIFTRPLSQADAERLWDEDQGAPMFNRAIAGAYPVGSVYKPITAIAALDAGLIRPDDVIQDNGKITISGQTFTNAGSEPKGPVDLERAMEVSSDVYFYLLGQKMNGTSQLQDWSARFGIGESTGIDLTGESSGLLPTPAWRDALYETGDTDRPWAVGDNVQLSIGQGDLQANPLQMAVAYAALGNGGTILKPNLVLQTEDVAGRVLREIEPEAARKIVLDPVHRDRILAGLNKAAQAPDGTSYQVFGGFPVKIAGKTGTAERPPYGDQSWYVALAPYPNPRIAVAVTVEQGGFGADTAAPVTLQILSSYFDKTARPVSGGSGNVE
jgi:penicillin-binding protein 2